MNTSAKWRVIGLVSCLIIFGVLTFIGCYYYGDIFGWVSRFLALLGVLQQPGKTQEGMQVLVTLLAPDTTVKVSPYCLRPVEMGQPLGFYGDDDFLLDGNTPLGDEAMDAGSQLLVALTTDNEQEAQGWNLSMLLSLMLCAR